VKLFEIYLFSPLPHNHNAQSITSWSTYYLAEHAFVVYFHLVTSQFSKQQFIKPSMGTLTLELLLLMELIFLMEYE